MKKLSLILFILFLMNSFCLVSQTTPRRMRETKNQKMIHRHIYHHNGWVYKKTPAGKYKNYSKHLFTRHRPAVYYKKKKCQERINRQRALHRKRGNEYFHKRKYY